MDDQNRGNGKLVEQEAILAVDEQRSRGSIRSMRNQLGMTQEELAQALGITVGTVSRWEMGRFRPSRLARSLISEFARAHHLAVSFPKPHEQE